MRVSRKQLDGTVARLNSALESKGSSARLVLEGRYGHTGLDVATVDMLERSPGSVSRTLTVGTTGELAQYLRGMQEALWLLEPPYS